MFPLAEMRNLINFMQRCLGAKFVGAASREISVTDATYESHFIDRTSLQINSAMHGTDDTSSASNDLSTTLSVAKTRCF